MIKNKKEILSNKETQQKPLRLWPGVVIVILQWLIRFVLPRFVTDPNALMIAVFGGILGGLAIVVWWAFFSRAHWTERWGAIVLMIASVIGTSSIIHESIATGGQGMMFFIFVIPPLSLAFVIWSVAGRRLSKVARRVTMVITILLACGFWTLFRSDGITGDFNPTLTWRWAETHEDRLMAQSDNESMTLPSAEAETEIRANWPGFRGPDRNSIIHGIQIKTDWSTSPPVELWRLPIGPGCSSFAVRGSLLYTQEQRGEDEVVSCYNLTTGKPVWRHRDTARFWDSHAGAGPRSTPTLSGDCVYTFGATGILNVLNARDGSVVWSLNAASDIKVKILEWAFTSSPLVVDDLVIIAVSGTLAAYDIATGEPRWVGPDGGGSFSSPHLMTIHGVRQILLISRVGVTSFAPTDGTILWKYPWGVERIVQPAITTDGELLLSDGGGKGIRRIGVTSGPDGWTVKERWTSKRLRPNFNDFVIHKGHAFGFNGSSLACIDIKTGKRKWKGGRYGGQLILLADQDVLLVLSEKGELALVEAVSDKLTELAQFPAIEGKTWNHPILAGDILVVRNTQEMAAFRLSLASD